MKLKHIAVVLRGHVRTWNFCAPKVFDFYNQIAEDVDYYFIVWDTSNTEGIKETFKDQNLIHYQIVSHTFDTSELSKGDMLGKYYNAHLGPPFMQTLIIPHKKQREKELGYTYDAIFDSRPDVLPIRKHILHGKDTGSYIPFVKPEYNSVYVTGLELQTNQSEQSGSKSGKKDIAIQDWFLYMGSNEFEQMAQRYHPDRHVYTDDNGPGTQIELREYAEVNNLFICTSDWVRAFMMRPSVYRLDWLDSKDDSELITTANLWQDLDRDEKIALCERYGISLSDYMDTPSITCKI
jgi:hypothetical protein|tara:strand:- start:436 stop:1314 length:879 start_codon:yes stop_codon:yes gene_type:complete